MLSDGHLAQHLGEKTGQRHQNPSWPSGLLLGQLGLLALTGEKCSWYTEILCATFVPSKICQAADNCRSHGFCFLARLTCGQVAGWHLMVEHKKKCLSCLWPRCATCRRGGIPGASHRQGRRRFISLAQASWDLVLHNHNMLTIFISSLCSK